jgi:hypothetical protein
LQGQQQQPRLWRQPSHGWFVQRRRDLEFECFLILRWILGHRGVHEHRRFFRLRRVHEHRRFFRLRRVHEHRRFFRLRRVH